MRKKTIEGPKVGDKVKYKGSEYTIVQLYDFGLATIENEATRLLVQYEDLKGGE